MCSEQSCFSGSSNAVNLEICVAATVLTPLTPLLGLYFGSQAHWQLNLFGEHIKGFVGIIFCPSILTKRLVISGVPLVQK